MASISLVTLGVQDLVVATSFYETLGWRKSTYSVDGVVSFLAGGTVVLALYGKDALGSDSHTTATASYAVNVDSPAEVDALMATAAAAGATITSPGAAAEWGGYVGYFTDADGHLWEVTHNPDFPLDDDGRVYLPGLERYAEEARQQTEAQISDFIASADAAVADLASSTLRTLTTAYDEIRRQLGGQPNNTVIATMLELGQRARSLPPTESQHWVANAASTLVSSLLGAGG